MVVEHSSVVGSLAFVESRKERYSGMVEMTAESRRSSVQDRMKILMTGDLKKSVYE